MAMFAEVLAIGPFKQSLISHYEYPPTLYARTKEGVEVVRTLFGITEGTNASTEFAKALGVSDPLDFNQHKLTPAAIDIDAVRSTLLELQDWTDGDYQQDLDALAAFVAERYALYFLSNA